MAIKLVKVGREVVDHKRLGRVILNYSLRAKRLSISVNSKCEVRLTMPAGSNLREARAFLDREVEWVEATLAKVRRISVERDNSPMGSLRPLTVEQIEELYVRAAAYLPQRTRELAKQFNFKVNRVSVRAARSRWGSCSTVGNISLNIFLMVMPDYLIDYVIIHELCHTIHHNHSPQFHAEVDRCVNGREKEFIREVKGYRCGFIAP